jgi:hypothetical protein
MSTAAGLSAGAWCPRCDDLAAVEPDTPCVTCAAPRLRIDPPRPATARRRTGTAAPRPSAAGRRHPHRRYWSGTGGWQGLPTTLREPPEEPATAPLPGGSGERARRAAPQEPATAAPTDGSGGGARLAAPGSAGRAAEPAGGVPASAHGAPPPDTGPPAPAGAPAGPVRGRWRRIAGAVLGAVVVLTVLGRLVPEAPSEARAARPAAPVGPQLTRPPALRLPTARPRLTLPGRGPMLGRGASGWMVVEYDGWLWRQPLAGGTPHPAARLRQGAGHVVLSPSGDRFALVRTRSWGTRMEVRSLLGGGIQFAAAGVSPAWSPDGRLAFVRVSDRSRSAPSLSRPPVGAQLHVVGQRKLEVLPLPSTLQSATVGWTGDGHPLLLSSDASRLGLFGVERGRLRQLLPAGSGPPANRRPEALVNGLLRPHDAAGTLGAALAGVPRRLAALAADGQRVALVTGAREQPRLEVRAPGRRITSGLPADRYLSVHWSVGGNFVWVEGERTLLAVEVVSGRVVPAGPGLPAGARLLGFVA